MGNRFSRCSCCSCFRAVFRPGLLEPELPLKPMPKPPPGDATTGTAAAPTASTAPTAPDGANTVDGASGKAAERPEVLTVRSIDGCFQHNGAAHHTDRFDLMKRENEPRLVVRRGQPFQLVLTTSRQYDPLVDGISIIFTAADEDRPSHGHGTLVAVPLVEAVPTTDENSNEWSAVAESWTDDKLTVIITAAADCAVAPWSMDVDTRLLEGETGTNAISYSYPTRIYILYNAWCKQDSVYMSDAAWRDECVLADTGLIWRGSHNRLRPSVWKYGQHERDVLEAALHVIHTVGGVKSAARGSAVRTARALSAAVNSVDEDGCVEGNWSNKFDGGTAPTQWLGTAEILRKYYKHRKPVKFGQCWVFGGVLTTVCRAVGIPSRVVTNYSSAHDTHGSLTVDYFVDEHGKVMEELNSDSVWNFHVWNEVWMKRPDLGDGDNTYDGWQVIDSTPQELSGEAYCCGPASVAAVKRGEVERPYDTGFLYAEVNADKLFWRYTGPTQPLKLLRRDTEAIGRAISTKAPGKWEREDITDSYKHPEHTELERTTMLNALRRSGSVFARYYLNEDFNDVKFDFELLDDIKIGQPFDVAVLVKNRGSEKRAYMVQALLRVDCVLYTGRQHDPVKTETVQREIAAGAEERVHMRVTYEEYAKHLLDQCAFSISCLVTVADTDFEYYAQDDFRVRKPDIKVRLLGSPVVGQEITAEISVENPLPVSVHKGVFTVNAPGLDGDTKLKVGYTVQSGKHANAGFKFTPTTKGRATIVAKFTSKEMEDVDGFLNFMVAPPKNDDATNGNVS